MIGLVILVIIGLWGGFGYLLWMALVRPRFRRPPALGVVTAFLGILWFVGPVADEIVGARQFDRLCAERQGIEFYGPVSVGVGPFFNGDGTPTWSSERDLQNRPLKEWDAVFSRKESTTVLRNWPMPIVDWTVVHVQKSTGRPVVVAHYIGSPGGLIRRWTSWSMQASYHCQKPIEYPPRKDWIAF